MKNGGRYYNYCGALQMSKTLLVFMSLLLLMWIASNKPVTYFTLKPYIGTRKFFTANSKYGYKQIDTQIDRSR